MGGEVLLPAESTETPIWSGDVREQRITRQPVVSHGRPHSRILGLGGSLLRSFGCALNCYFPSLLRILQFLVIDNKFISLHFILEMPAAEDRAGLAVCHSENFLVGEGPPNVLLGFVDFGVQRHDSTACGKMPVENDRCRGRCAQ